MGAQSAILFHLCAVSGFITLVVAYIVHGLIYPRVSGVIPLGPHQVDYKVGRIPFVNSGRFFVSLYQRWWLVDDVNSFLKDTGKDLRFETKSFWTHMLDCGLLYPAIFVYAWTALNHVLFK